MSKLTLDPKEQPETICVIDDDPDLKQLLTEVLQDQRYKVLAFPSAVEFLKWHESSPAGFNLAISDISMPTVSGYELCRRVRANPASRRTPVILITGGDSIDEKAMGLEVGADEFIRKPFNRRELLAKVRSLLKLHAHDIRTRQQLSVARERNTSLRTRLELEAHRAKKLGTLKQFLPNKLGDLLTSDARESLLEPHRGDVTVLFTDLRRFTAFSSRVEPEEVITLLGAYYTAVGNSAIRHGGTLGHLAGDGIMIFFNDPEPVERHQEVATRMALEVRAALAIQRETWRERQYDIDFGMGLAQGNATIGGIGFEQFWQYSVIGPVTNFAARLCQAADEGQILVSRRFLTRMGSEFCNVRPLGSLALKGIQKPVLAYDILTLKEQAEASDTSRLVA